VFPPIGDNLQDAFDYIKQLHDESNINIEMERIPEAMVEIIRENLPHIQIIEDRNNFDYVYRTPDLRDLPGGDYFNERKKLNKIKRTYQLEFVPLNQELISEVADSQDSWCESRDCEEDPSLLFEHHAIQDILTNWTTLKFSGGVLRLDGKIKAYTLGEALNLNTMVTHVEKADSEIIGLYQAINQQYAEIIAADYDFINREQDLGIENLRYAKTNYHPVKMIKKFKAQF
jgi:hypothetical protein